MGNMNSNEPEEPPSKSARKREATALQDLGVELADLPDEELAALELPENLRDAIGALKRMSSNGARLRQRQYIGKLMRKTDPEPIRARLAERKRRHDVEVRRFQEIERWRDRLLREPDGALEELLRERPKADADGLRALLRRAAGASGNGAQAASRELFAHLRRLFE